MKRAVLILMTVCWAAPLAAQQDSTLAAAVQLATEGRGDSARALVARRMAGLTPTDSLYAEALYAAGIVAGDAERSMNYFRRVSIEYASSAWADRALLRMAQLAFASGDASAALRSAQKIISDYPLSPVLGEAKYWAGRSLLELGNPQDGCTLLGQAEEAAGSDIELANRVRYQLQRCSALARGDTTRQPAPPAPAARPGGPVFSVQVAAVGSAVAADELMRSLRASGYDDSHVVRTPDGLFKVRVGRYTEREDAQRVAAEVKQRLGGSPFVVEEQ
jgi:tetratricopeptide (TPR) repeat protein